MRDMILTITFKDGYEYSTPVIIPGQFYLFAGLESLTVFIPCGTQMDVDKKYITYCLWDICTMNDRKYADITLDFNSPVSSISLT